LALAQRAERDRKIPIGVVWGFESRGGGGVKRDGLGGRREKGRKSRSDEGKGWRWGIPGKKKLNLKDPEM